MSESKAPPRMSKIDRTVAYDFQTEARVWPSLTGKVVPATPAQIRSRDAKVNFHERRMISAATADLAAAEAEAIVKVNAAFYAGQIREWSLDCPVSAANIISCLPEEAFRGLEDVVTGWGGLVLGNSEGTSSSSPSTPSGPDPAEPANDG